MTQRQRVLNEIALAIERGFLSARDYQQEHEWLDEQIVANLPDLGDMKRSPAVQVVNITPEGRWVYE